VIVPHEFFRVVITDLLDDDLRPEREVLDHLAEVTALQARSEAELVGRIEQADALIVYHEVALTRLTLERLQKCRVIVRGGVGFDNVDGALARQFGIPLANTPDYGSEEVADSALGMLLALTRGIHRANSVLRAGPDDWTYQVCAPLVRLRHRVLGIVGLGRIGTAMAVRGKALGMEVVFFDPYKPDGYDKALGIRRIETLDELLAQSLVVSLHCPLSAETHHLIIRRTIAACREAPIW
jgi:C-terminal binding protein